MSLKDYRTSLMPHITALVADATAGKAQPLGALAPSPMIEPATAIMGSWGQPLVLALQPGLS